MEGDGFDLDELLNFPCAHLRTIDRLWVKYSNGHFGFSVQKEIYLRVGGKADGKYYGEAWKKFGVLVGWRVESSWILYPQLNFDTSSPRGHLPGVRGERSNRFPNSKTIFPFNMQVHIDGEPIPRMMQKLSCLASRLVNCNISGF